MILTAPILKRIRSVENMASSFTVTLDNKDWYADLGGWRCPALNIPGSQVGSLFDDGSIVDDKLYRVDAKNAVIRWAAAEHPKRVVAQIDLTKELSTQELTSFWKKLALLLPLITALGTGTIALVRERYFPPQSDSAGSNQQSDKGRVLPTGLTPEVLDLDREPDWLRLISQGYRLQAHLDGRANSEGNFQYNVSSVDFKLPTATKRFTLALSPSEPQFRITGRAFRVTKAGLVQPLNFEGVENSIRFNVPECEAGDNVVTVLKASWSGDSSVQDIRSTFRLEIKQ